MFARSASVGHVLANVGPHRPDLCQRWSRLSRFGGQNSANMGRLWRPAHDNFSKGARGSLFENVPNNPKRYMIIHFNLRASRATSDPHLRDFSSKPNGCEMAQVIVLLQPLHMSLSRTCDVRDAWLKTSWLAQCCESCDTHLAQERKRGPGMHHDTHSSSTARCAAAPKRSLRPGTHLMVSAHDAHHSPLTRARVTSRSTWPPASSGTCCWTVRRWRDTRTSRAPPRRRSRPNGCRG